jgi:hypothetical protein
MNNQKGFVNIILIIIAVVVLITTGAIVVTNKSNLDLIFPNNQTPVDSFVDTSVDSPVGVPVVNPTEPTCGDGICEGEESMEVCPQCDPIEGSNFCPIICHVRCPEDCTDSGQTCGNGICDDNEYGPYVIQDGIIPDHSGKTYCPQDCPASI